MDAEIEVLNGELIEPAPPEDAPTGVIERARAAAASPRVQGAAAATAGMIVGATTLALLRRGGRAAAAGAVQRASPRSVGPTQAGWPPGPTIGPIQPGTYIVRVRAIGGLPPQQQSQ